MMAITTSSSISVKPRRRAAGAGPERGMASSRAGEGQRG
jgi:hypothetical protein